jgi:uncharacterized membrane protein YidH (DUF202 family)
MKVVACIIIALGLLLAFGALVLMLRKCTSLREKREDQHSSAVLAIGSLILLVLALASWRQDSEVLLWDRQVEI